MSGLEKFQANDAWRAHFKKLLLVKRKITSQSTDPIKQSQRFSLDIADDLAVILEEKKIPRRIAKAEDNIISKSAKLTSEEIKEEKTELSKKMFRVEDKENRYTNANNRQSVPSVKFLDKNLATVKRYTGVSQYEDTLVEAPEDEPAWKHTSDESFEAIEMMCNKTASDPDSTLFQYLHSDQKETIVESAKKRSRSGETAPLKSYDAEANALQRLLDELHVEEEMQLANESPLKGIDVTALEDIEAPSRLWENTITNETLLQTSPVKMVGLLRPSTILEEYEREDVSSSDVSSLMSFQSASKGAPSEVSTSSYDTAHDFASGSETAASVETNVVCNKESQSQKISSKGSLSEVSTSSHKAAHELVGGNNTASTEVTNSESNLWLEKNSKPTISLLSSLEPMEPMPCDINNKLIDLNESVDLIDLEKTFVASSESSQAPISEETSAHKIKNDGLNEEVIDLKGMSVLDFCNFAASAVVDDHIELSDSDDSVIEIFSEDEDVADVDDENVADVDDENVADVDDETIAEKAAGVFNATKSPNIKHENISAAEPSSSILSSKGWGSLSLDDCKENYSGLDRSADTSLNLNDTMEEVDYIMKKGMQYLAASAAAKLPTPKKSQASPTAIKISQLKSNQHTFSMSPNADNRYRSPSPMLHKHKTLLSTSAGKGKHLNVTPKTAEKPIAKPKPLNQFSKEMKPFPKLEIFKKPTTSCLSTNGSDIRHKEVATKQFSHIVSPIRAYIKQSTNTPLMFTINSINQNPKSLNSMRDLENESRLYKPNFDMGHSAAAVATPITVTLPRSLPKKAYISSEFKHIVDERTPVTIPGGKQYQKHIETAMLPAVLKHEGKMKMPGLASSRPGEKSRNSSPSSHIQRRTDASLADLSLMSGDISMYTIKDARKF